MYRRLVDREQYMIRNCSRRNGTRNRIQVEQETGDSGQETGRQGLGYDRKLQIGGMG